ncbi:uncharacterized protein [Procambarus clarkii]|uniref:uncharacterized protein n=1 Tax=Procambarus clarkii TaxID=6728 RepID=UPI001E67012E|nr:uncharacterized protein LOC123770309 [Procambarus clarkii]
MAPGRHRDDKKKMTRTEAEEIMETDARSKDFWTVDYDYDNCHKLQRVLDVLYNSVSGNNYEVDYQENQNGTRLIIRCNICSKDLTSYDPFYTHENGRNHKKCRQQVLTPKDPNISGTLQRRFLNEPRETFERGSLEDDIDSTKLPILGVQFVYKEVINGEELFTCQLCEKDDKVTRIRSRKMFSHLVSKCHSRKYLEVKFGFSKKEMDFEDSAKEIEELEGKIHANIADFTKQLPPNMIRPKGHTKHRISRSRSRSQSRSRHSPSRSPSHSRSRRSVSRSRNGKFGSASCSRWSESPARNLHSKSSSPRKSKSNSPVPADPVIILPEPAKPLTFDVEVTADMSENCKPVLKEVNLLQEVECREMLQKDTDMQDLLIQTLWVLNQKLHKWYIRTGGLVTAPGEERVPLSTCTSKVWQNIEKLELIPPIPEKTNKT